MSALQGKTIEHFKSHGYIVGSVERRKRFPAKGKPPCRACGSLPMIDISHDLWNVFDLIAVRPVDGKLPARVLIQTTSASNHATRRTKILTSPEARFCLMAGISLCIESWRKVKNRWQPTDEWLTLDQFPRSLPATVPDFYEEQKRAKMPDFPPGVPMFSSPILDEECPF